MCSHSLGDPELFQHEHPQASRMRKREKLEGEGKHGNPSSEKGDERKKEWAGAL